MRDLVIRDMANCEQFHGQSILEHGLSCASRLMELLLKNEHGQTYKWVLPDWFWLYRDLLISNVCVTNEEAYEYALMHDCGKPYCRVIDTDGKQHFPDHHKVSYDTYLKINDNKKIADLILHDMDIHLLKANGVEQFCQNRNAALHLLAGIAEINSNAEYSNGFDSINFKIKFKSLSQRGKAICNFLLKGE